MLAVVCQGIYLFIVSTAWELLRRRFTCYAILVCHYNKTKKYSITYVDVPFFCFFFIVAVLFYFLSSYLLCVVSVPSIGLSHHTHKNTHLKSNGLLSFFCRSAHTFFYSFTLLLVGYIAWRWISFVLGSMKIRACHQAGHKLPKQMGILFVEHLKSRNILYHVYLYDELVVFTNSCTPFN